MYLQTGVVLIGEDKARSEERMSEEELAETAWLYQRKMVLQASIVSRMDWAGLRELAAKIPRLLSELRQSREREEKLQRHNIGLYEEMQEVQDTLAEALGYALDEEHGWVTGEHTVVTLALEAKSKLQGYRRDQ